MHAVIISSSKLFCSQCFSMAICSLLLPHLTCFVTLRAGKGILLRSDVRKTFSLHFIAVPKCEAVTVDDLTVHETKVCSVTDLLYCIECQSFVLWVHNYWILKGPANNHKCQQFSNRSSSFLKSSTFTCLAKAGAGLL
jgi:hypothetical protein